MKGLVGKLHFSVKATVHHTHVQGSMCVCVFVGRSMSGQTLSAYMYRTRMSPCVMDESVCELSLEKNQNLLSLHPIYWAPGEASIMVTGRAVPQTAQSRTSVTKIYIGQKNSFLPE